MNLLERLRGALTPTPYEFLLVTARHLHVTRFHAVRHTEATSRKLAPETLCGHDMWYPVNITEGADAVRAFRERNMKRATVQDWCETCQQKLNAVT